MKHCRAAAVVLIAILVLIALNAFGIHRVTNRLLDELESLPEVPDPSSTPADVVALRERLNEYATFIALSVHYNMLDRAIEALYSLEAYARACDVAQYEATRAALRDLLDDLGRLERFKLENIL